MALLDVGLHLDCPAATYYACPTAEPALSQSIAKVLLNRSPAHAYLAHPRLGGKPERASSGAMDRGTIIHAMLLGGGAGFVVVDADDWRTKAAREQRDEARAAGLTPILTHQFEDCAEVARRLDDHVPGPPTKREVTAVWRSAGDVLCCGRLDVLSVDEALILDIKTGEDARRASEGRNVVSQGLHIQAAAYLDAVETLVPELAGRWRFEFMFAETSEPFGMIRAELSGELLELGRRKWRRAVERWGACLAAGQWPAYGDEVVRVECPPWATADDLEEEMAREWTPGALDEANQSLMGGAA